MNAYEVTAQKLYQLLLNLKNQELKLNHILNFINGEIENPTPHETMSKEEKVEGLLKLRETYEKDIAEFRELKQKELKTIKAKMEIYCPDLWILVESRLLVDEMFQGH